MRSTSEVGKVCVRFRVDGGLNGKKSNSVLGCLVAQVQALVAFLRVGVRDLQVSAAGAISKHKDKEMTFGR